MERKQPLSLVHSLDHAVRAIWGTPRLGSVAFCIHMVPHFPCPHLVLIGAPISVSHSPASLTWLVSETLPWLMVCIPAVDVAQPTGGSQLCDVYEQLGDTATKQVSKKITSGSSENTTEVGELCYSCLSSRRPPIDNRNPHAPHTERSIIVVAP